MLDSLQVIKLDSSILDISVDEEFVSTIHNRYRLQIFERESHELAKSVALVKKELVLHPYDRIFHLCSINKTALIPSPSGAKVSLLRFLPTLRQLHTTSLHREYVTASAICPSGRYICTIDRAGRGFVIDTAKGSCIFKLPNRPDSGSKVLFASDSLLLGAYYDRQNFLYDPQANRMLHEFESGDVIEDADFTHTHLVYVCRDGRFGVLEIANGAKKEIKAVDAWLSRVAVFGGEYVIMGDKEGNIYAYSIKKQERFLSFCGREVGIASLCIHEHGIYVGYIDGHIEIYDALSHAQSYEVHIKMEEFANAAELLEKNRFLLLHPATTRFEESWARVRKECAQLIAKGEEQKAHKLAVPFFFNSSFREEFEELLLQKESVTKLFLLFRKKQFAAVLQEGEKKPFIRELEVYRDCEAVYERFFQKAKKMLYENPANKEEPKKLLARFKGVKSKKEQIDTLLNKSALFAKAEKLLREKRFPAYFALCEEYDFLRDTPVYAKARGLISGAFEKALRQLQEGRRKEARSAFLFLEKCVLLEREAKEQLAYMDICDAFKEAVAKKEIKTAFDIFMQHPHLRSLPEYETLLQHYNAIILKAEEIKLEGKPKELKKALGELIGVEYCFMRVEAMMLECYLAQIARFSKSKKVNLKASYDRVVYIFGPDEEIVQAAKKHGVASFGYEKAVQSPKNREYYDSVIVTS